MPFPQSVKDEAFRHSGGRCECTREHPGRINAPHHGGRCPRPFSQYGGQWEAHHITAESVGGSDFLSNCEVLCLTCHQLTQSYGRSG
ncbi:MAG: HNH endonuclease [Chloroflexi bacterium]|nr:HNH endonuclease [Chloroflexota bacterium]